MRKAGYNPRRSMICSDKRRCKQIGEIIMPIPMKPGNPKRESITNTVSLGHAASLWPLNLAQARERLVLRENQAKMDCSHFMDELARHYPEAGFIVLSHDNLNAHTAVSFYEALSSEEAFGPLLTTLSLSRRGRGMARGV
jgi:hypothetical protein